MTDIVPTITEIQKPGYGEGFIATWVLANSETGEGVGIPGYNERTVQAAGTFGGATVTMNGTLDGTNYAGVRDPSSTALTFTTAGIKTVLETTRKLQPVVSGGGGTTALTVTVLFTKAKR